MTPAVAVVAGENSTRRVKHSPTRKVEAAREGRSRSQSRRQCPATVNTASASVRVLWSLSRANRPSAALTNIEHYQLRAESEPNLFDVKDEVEAMRYKAFPISNARLVRNALDNELQRTQWRGRFVNQISNEQRHATWLRHQYKKASSTGYPQ